MIRRLFIINILIAILLVLASRNHPVYAQEPGPQSAPPPDLTQSAPPPTTENNTLSVTPALAGLPPLKAVLVVGPIDQQTNGVPGASTQQEIANMELAAAALQSQGVQVLKFYAPNDRWSNIVAAANGAHFFMYRGHGIFWNGDVNTPEVGGFGLTERMYSNHDIKRDIKLAPNAIVMLHACFATGSSTTDPGSITQTESRRRISQYSQPFFEMGAAGYYANWYGDAFQVFINNLFAGQTLGNAFKNYHDFEATKWAASTHQNYPNIPLWMSWETWNDYPIDPPIYNNAFAGFADKTLTDLFKPTITLSSSSLAYITKPSSQARVYQVTVQSNAGATFSWVASPASGSNPSWVKYTPSNGANGTTLSVTITPPGSTGKFQTTILVKSADGSIQQSLNVTLITLNDPKMVFLPTTIR